MSTNKPGYFTGIYRKGRRRMLHNLGGCCTTCGSTNNLEIHHKYGIQLRGKQTSASRGGRIDRLKDWNREYHLNRLFLLCHECHVHLHIREYNEEVKK